MTQTKKMPFQGAFVLVIGIWCLEFVWNLVLVIWNLSPINTFASTDVRNGYLPGLILLFIRYSNRSDSRISSRRSMAKKARNSFSNPATS